MRVSKLKCKPLNAKALALYDSLDPIAAMEEVKKINLLKEADAFIRSLDSRIIQVVVSLAGVHEEILIAASDGTLAADIRP